MCRRGSRQRRRGHASSDSAMMFRCCCRPITPESYDDGDLERLDDYALATVAMPGCGYTPTTHPHRDTSGMPDGSGRNCRSRLAISRRDRRTEYCASSGSAPDQRRNHSNQKVHRLLALQRCRAVDSRCAATSRSHEGVACAHGDPGIRVSRAASTTSLAGSRYTVHRAAWLAIENKRALPPRSANSSVSSHPTTSSQYS